MPLRQCAPDLFSLSDGSCTVYVIRRGDRAILIDCAGGEVLDELGTIGVSSVDWVLFTHHHRDQCHGSARLVEAGARLAVPWHERALFESVEDYWQQKRLYDNYNDRSTFFSLAESVPVTTYLQDYETFTWHDVYLEIVPAPGHTHGQIALVGDLGQGTLAFTGDLICQGGQLYQLHAMEYEYGDLAGVHWTSTALDQLRKRHPRRLLPSHGQIIDDAEGDIQRLDVRLHRLLEHTPYRSAPARGQGVTSDLQFAHETPMAQLSDHLLWGEEVTCSNFFVIRADAGKALLIDYPYHSNGLFPTALHHGEPTFGLRFIEHHLDELRTDWGVTQIDVVIPTHIHDDHVCGIPYLQRHCDTRVWSLDRVAEVLATPTDWNTPCLLTTPIRSDRIFTDGERFSWEGFDFEIVFYPGQTEFHAAILCENLDGRRVLFAGDSSYPIARYMPGADGWMVNTVLRNSLTFQMHRKCAEEFERLRPDFLCPGHGPVWDVGPEAIGEHHRYVEEKEALWRDVVASPATAGIDLFWARLHPYQVSLLDGRATVKLLLRNSFERPALFDVHLQAPPGMDTSPAQRIQLATDEETELSFELTGESSNRRRVLTASIHVDGQPQGPVAEALITQERA